MTLLWVLIPVGLLLPLVIYGIVRYSHPMVTPVQKACLFIFLSLSVYPIILVFADIFSKIFEGDVGGLEENWRVVIYSSLVGCWVIFPFLSDFLTSKYASIFKKILESFFKLVIVSVVVALIVVNSFLFLPNELGQNDFVSVVIALHLIFCLFLVLKTIVLSMMELPKFLSERVLSEYNISKFRDELTSRETQQPQILKDTFIVYSKAFSALQTGAISDPRERKKFRGRLLDQVIAFFPPGSAPIDSQTPVSLEDIDAANIRFLSSVRSIERLRQNIDYISQNEGTFKLRLIKGFQSRLEMNATMFGVMAVLLELTLPFSNFGFNFFQLLSDKVSVIFALINILQLMVYVIGSVFFGLVNLSVFGKISVEKGLTSFSTFVSLARLAQKKNQLRGSRDLPQLHSDHERKEF